MIVMLPWPPAALSPNSRAHWAKKAKAVKAYRRDCGYATVGAKGRAGISGPASLSVTFRPPNARPRDMDNLLASIKAGLDGICDALAINDRQFGEITVRRGETARGGVVVVEIHNAGVERMPARADDGK